MHHYICPSACDMNHYPWHMSYMPWNACYVPWHTSLTPWHTYNGNPHLQSGPIFAVPLAPVRRHILP